MFVSSNIAHQIYAIFSFSSNNYLVGNCIKSCSKNQAMSRKSTMSTYVPVATWSALPAAWVGSIPSDWAAWETCPYPVDVVPSQTAAGRPASYSTPSPSCPLSAVDRTSSWSESSSASPGSPAGSPRRSRQGGRPWWRTWVCWQI